MFWHARIQEFSSGGSRSVWQKKLWQRFFLFFFLDFSLFNRSQMVDFKEIYHFSRFQRGSNIFQEGGGGGVQLLIPHRNPYKLWFSRGGGSGPPAPPPPWIRTCLKSKFCIVYRVLKSKFCIVCPVLKSKFCIVYRVLKSKFCIVYRVLKSKFCIVYRVLKSKFCIVYRVLKSKFCIVYRVLKSKFCIVETNLLQSVYIDNSNCRKGRQSSR